jgi:hypothetical protein
MIVSKNSFDEENKRILNDLLSGKNQEQDVTPFTQKVALDDIPTIVVDSEIPPGLPSGETGKAVNNSSEGEKVTFSSPEQDPLIEDISYEVVLDEKTQGGSTPSNEELDKLRQQLAEKNDQIASMEGIIVNNRGLFEAARNQRKEQYRNEANGEFGQQDINSLKEKIGIAVLNLSNENIVKVLKSNLNPNNEEHKNFVRQVGRDLNPENRSEEEIGNARKAIASALADFALDVENPKRFNVMKNNYASKNVSEVVEDASQELNSAKTLGLGKQLIKGIKGYPGHTLAKFAAAQGMTPDQLGAIGKIAFGVSLLDSMTPGQTPPAIKGALKMLATISLVSNENAHNNYMDKVKAAAGQGAHYGMHA